MPEVFRQLARKNKRLEEYRIAGAHHYKPKNSRNVIDLEMIRNMAGMGCTLGEMAGLLGCSAAWLGDEKERNPHVAMALEEGYATMKQSLRRAQLDLALSGNAPMLIWLGKQCLEQSDQHKIENKTTISITVQKAMDELRNIPKDQLLAAQALLSAPLIEHQEEGDAPAAPAPPHPPV